MASEIFNSTNHKRFEHGKEVSHDYVPRLIKMEYITPDKTGMMFSIFPTLTPKPAKKLSDTGSMQTYVGLDPIYKFVIYRVGNQIVRVSLFRLDRNLELHYF